MTSYTVPTPAKKQGWSEQLELQGKDFEHIKGLNFDKLIVFHYVLQPFLLFPLMFRCKCVKNTPVQIKPL